ncbi:MAG: lysylphosphatidylglycerol synthase transmembrane domain-containing protein [Bacteroidota bacterium]
MKKTLINVLKYAAATGFGILLLYLALKDISWDEFTETVRNANLGWLLFSMAIGGFSHYIRGVRWGMQYRAFGYNPSNLRLFSAVMFGYLVNQAIPRGGEVARCSILIKSDKIPFAKSVGSVVVERVFDLLILVILIGVAFVLEIDVLESMLSEFFPNGVSGVGLLAIIGGVGLTGLVSYFAFRKHFLNIPLFKKLDDFVMNLFKSALSVKDIEKPWLFIVYTIIIWVCYILMTYVAFFALEEVANLDINLLYFSVIVTVIGGIGMALPSPGGIGSYHTAVWVVFAALMVTGAYESSKSLGVTWAFIMHLSQFVMMVSLGILGYIYLSYVAPEVDSAMEGFEHEEEPVEATS